tara:strand:- start:746 stop:1666 length:921 start_codon:yes stop_codon:yes gene_type:complete
MGTEGYAARSPVWHWLMAGIVTMTTGLASQGHASDAQQPGSQQPGSQQPGSQQPGTQPSESPPQNPTKPPRSDQNTAATAPTHAPKTELPPLAAWQFVKIGNAAFVRSHRHDADHGTKIPGSGHVTKKHHDNSSGGKQHETPLAKRPAGAGKYVCAVITCADAPYDIPPMLGLARRDVLVLRMAGPFVNAEAVALLDRALLNYNTSLILVLSHDQCESLQMRIKGADDALDRRLTPIRAAARKRQRTLAETIGPNQRDLLLASSNTMRDLVKRDRLRIMPGVIHSKTGAVKWLQRRAQELPLSPVK